MAILYQVDSLAEFCFKNVVVYCCLYKKYAAIFNHRSSSAFSHLPSMYAFVVVNESK